jgi:hypothetical protein
LDTVFLPSKEAHFSLFYKGFPSFVSLYSHRLLVLTSLRIPWASLLLFGERASEQIVEKEGAQSFNRFHGQSCQKA